MAFTENAFAIAGGRSGLGLYNTFLNNFYKVPPSQQPVNYLKPAQMPQYPGICAYINFISLFGGSNPCPSSGFSPMPYADAFQVIGTTFGQPAVGATKSLRHTSSQVLRRPPVRLRVFSLPVLEYRQ